MTQSTLHIVRDDLTDPQVLSLLSEHLAHMAHQSPPESMHALNAEALKSPGILFWAAWASETDLAGVAALKLLPAQCGQTQYDKTQCGEIKSMRTARHHRRTGVATRLLQHLIVQANNLNLETLYLETGSMPEFNAARALYLKFGFSTCKPFANYKEDHNSVFLQRSL